MYWQDKDAFFRDYAVSHKKLSELGFSPPSSGQKVGLALSIAAVLVLAFVWDQLTDISPDPYLLWKQYNN